ncbi:MULTISPECIES: MarR family winged helix-turn-helix transcriptional regulator [unclassified Streptomyces]|uniref:MarR family winged helix-turn-helix transcriptional regulator n=1 Tax=unclassified Streptomyces TaxID=2593676 RepID=UPI00093AB6C1|nr:MarR family transcriptional regulator [Streptomyces sp. CB02058]OKI94085.1 MarR family transcriptional regulator [Streptomyces sp. CB02058]
MSSADRTGADPSHDLGVDDGVRTLLLLMPRVVARTKRTPVPPQLEKYNLAPRHLSLLAYLYFDGPLAVSELATRLEVAPATVSLLVGELNGYGVVDRDSDPADRRRRIVGISEEYVEAVRGWLGNGVRAWRTALEPLSPAERRTFIDTLRVYERALTDEREGPADAG